jgi:hypothetical protein
MIYAAVVTEVMPAVPGVRVRFKDLAPSGFAQYDFARVLTPRMSSTGGAASWLPEVDELGVVGELEGGYLVWLGSLPFLDKNQADPTPGLAFWKHQSGVVLQVRENGDTELSHPSGLRFTVSRDGDALPALQATSQPPARDGVVPVLTISHPSGAEVKVDADGNGVLHGFASLTIQDGTKRFSMEGLFDFVASFVTWAKTHTHSGVTGGGGTTGAPVGLPSDPVADSCLSPATLKGPQGA